ncbi:MAG: SDR family oxidoreductase [Beijerinckiaceae bacterium]|nr:SDR family oxidoreductase [Beijerinckiaceae bacterium]
MGRLTGRVGIVTGASSGIGEAIAEALAAEGMAVLLAARRKDRLQQLAAKIEAAGGRARVCQTDVTNEDDVICLFHAANNEFARLDLLVNCAGIADATPTDQLSLARWREMVDANLTSAFLCAREALRVMKPQKRGRIINVASISAKMPRKNSIAYTSTKFALEGMTRSLALDGRPFGITASVIHPGATITELVPNMAGRPAAESMQASEVAAVVALIAALPDETNLLEATILPIGQPFLGRG